MGGGWIFVGKYERYEWAKSRGNAQSPFPSSPGGKSLASKGEVVTWTLVQSTYSHTKTLAAQLEGKRNRRKSTKSSLSEARTIRASMDNTASPERRLNARMTIMPDMPPSMIIRPRNPRMEGTIDEGGGEWSEEIEEINKQEIVNALVQGLWIVWREGVVDEINEGRRNSWVPAHQGQQKKRKKGIWDVILCRK